MIFIESPYESNHRFRCGMYGDLACTTLYSEKLDDLVNDVICVIKAGVLTHQPVVQQNIFVCTDCFGIHLYRQLEKYGIPATEIRTINVKHLLPGHETEKNN